VQGRSQSASASGLASNGAIAQTMRLSLKRSQAMRESAGGVMTAVAFGVVPRLLLKRA
jgi:hypothetical protein